MAIFNLNENLFYEEPILLDGFLMKIICKILTQNSLVKMML